MTEELKPCPFCGNKDVSVADTGSAWVRCLVPDCGCEGPVCESEIDAVHAWNCRVVVASAQRGPVAWRWKVSERQVNWCYGEAKTPNPDAVCIEPLYAAHLAEGRPSKEELAETIGRSIACMVSGNNMPHMSGDPRNRLSPLKRRHFDEACDNAAEAVLARLRSPAESIDQQLEDAGKAAIAIRNELDRTRADRDYQADLATRWKAQFDSAAAAASEYSEFWEKHSGDFDQFGNYVPYSQMDGDLRAARAEIEKLRSLSQPDSSSELAGLRQELEHERYNVEKTAQEGARRIKLLQAQVERLISCLKGYEQWEADIILENNCWTGMNVQLTSELYERMIQLQVQRNAALTSTEQQTRNEQ